MKILHRWGALCTLLFLGCGATTDSGPMEPGAADGAVVADQTVETDGQIEIDQGLVPDLALPLGDMAITGHPCDGVSCGPNGACEDGLCQCAEGYTLIDGVCADVDECAAETTPCGLNAQCINLPGDVLCRCNPGFEGDGVTCTDIDECANLSDNCADSAVCANTEGGFDCHCVDGYDGDGVVCVDIDECESDLNPCDENAACRNMPGAFECHCNDGWLGDGLTCEDIDECATDISNCSENATCRNTNGHFECGCNPGFVGDGVICADVDECADGTAQCGMNAVCENTVGSFLCQCNPGWMGDGFLCQDINECEQGHECGPDAICVNEPGRYTCRCPEGLRVEGRICRDIDECQTGAAQCGFNAACINTYGSYQCTCAPGYYETDDGCVDVDECAMEAFECHRFAQCLNRPGGYDCACRSGFEGDGRECADIDECVLGQLACPALSVCTNLPGSALCECNEGYEMLDGVCVNIDECERQLDDCDQDATCFDRPGSFECQCNDGFVGTGQVCEDFDECTAQTDECPAELPCRNIDGGFRCGEDAVFVCNCAVNDGDCQPGNDESTGLLPGEAWRTLDRVRVAAERGELPGGVVVRLCQGGRFEGGLAIGTDWMCTAETPCEISRYSTPAHPLTLPILTGGLRIDGAQDPDRGGYLQVGGIEFVAGDQEPAVTIAHGVREVLLDSIVVTGRSAGIVVGDPEAGVCDGGNCPRPENITIRNTNISYSRGSAIWADGQRIQIQDNEILNNGLGNAPQIYIACNNGPCEAVEIGRNNITIEDEPGAQSCSDPQILVQGMTTNTRILDNRIRVLATNTSFGCSGVRFSRGTLMTDFRDAVIARNLIVNPQDYGIALSSCMDCLVENNAISQNRDSFAIAINAPVRRGGGEHRDLEALTVRHNSIFMSSQIRGTSIAIKVSGNGRGHRLTGNAIVNLSQAFTTCCFDQARDVTIYAEHDANVCLLSEDNAFANWAIGFRSLAAWQMSTGYDERSVEGAPGFADAGPPVADFRILSPEALVVNRSLQRYAPSGDLLGTERDELPDTGAFELGLGEAE